MIQHISIHVNEVVFFSFDAAPPVLLYVDVKGDGDLFILSLLTRTVQFYSICVKPLVMMIFVLQNGRSPLINASYYGHLDVVITLIEAGANVNHTDKVGIYTCTLMLCIVAMAAYHPSHVFYSF